MDAASGRLARVLVTGAGGFVGGWITEALYLSNTASVRASVGRWASAARIARFPVEIVQCDVLSPEQVATALRGIDAVVHCARSDDPRVTAEGTRVVLAAARHAGIRRFVHISSVAVYGEAEGCVDEATPLAVGEATPYGLSKIAAEEHCRHAMAQGLPVVILRPTIIYGPFSELWTTNFARRLRSGRWMHLSASGEGKCNLVYIGDVVDAIIAALQIPEAVGEAFNINGTEILTWNAYFERLNEALGMPALRSMEPSRLRAYARITQPVRIAGKYLLARHREFFVWLANNSLYCKQLMKLTEDRLRATPNAAELALYRQDVTYSIEKARRILQYEPRTTLEAGLAHSCAWLKYAGVIA